MINVCLIEEIGNARPNVHHIETDSITIDEIATAIGNLIFRPNLASVRINRSHTYVDPTPTAIMAGIDQLTR